MEGFRAEMGYGNYPTGCFVRPGSLLSGHDAQRPFLGQRTPPTVLALRVPGGAGGDPRRCAHQSFNSPPTGENETFGLTSLVHKVKADQAADDLGEAVQQIKGVSPYTAAVIASHASRDPAAFGIDVWNRKILARRLLDANDAAPEAVTRRLNQLFPGRAGTAGLYFVEHEYLNAPVAPLLDPDGIDAWNKALERPAP